MNQCSKCNLGVYITTFLRKDCETISHNQSFLPILYVRFHFFPTNIQLSNLGII
uniref:Uncharacterized protein n=1 Tax=Anguilla anguilla TaxID=7936 RepID=A0A0E9PAA4_ANGAN